MRKLLLVLYASTVLCAQKGAAQAKPPNRLLQIMHCAQRDDMLPQVSVKNPVFKVSWAVNRDRDPEIGTEYFVVVYRSALEGDVLVYAREYRNGKLHLSMFNNASFRGRSGSYRYINGSDPLGGIWTQNHVRKNVDSALRSRRYRIDSRSFTGNFSEVVCHSYAKSEP